MFCSYETAIRSFSRISPALKSPTQDPTYIVIDGLRDKRLVPVFFTFQQDDQIFYHGGHLANLPGRKAFRSAYNYGGPITTFMETAFLKKANQALMATYRLFGITEEAVNFHPLLQNWQCYNGHCMPDRRTVWIDLTQDFYLQYRRMARAAIKKAQEIGVRVEWEAQGAATHELSSLYWQRMAELRAQKFYFFPASYFERLSAWEGARLASCRLGNEIVAMGQFIYQPDGIMEFHLAASTAKGRLVGAPSLLVHEAARLGQQLGCRALHLGGGKSSDPDDTLFFFKSRFSPLRGIYIKGQQEIPSGSQDGMAVRLPCMAKTARANVRKG